MIVKPDAMIDVRFRTTDEGGRETPISGGNFYACPLFIDGEGFDCRIFLQNNRIELGEWYRLPVKFLYPEYVKSKLLPGKTIILWEGKDIADGRIAEVLEHDK
jgi:hypothetical protein